MRRGLIRVPGRFIVRSGNEGGEMPEALFAPRRPAVKVNRPGSELRRCALLGAYQRKWASGPGPWPPAPIHDMWAKPTINDQHT